MLDLIVSVREDEVVLSRGGHSDIYIRPQEIDGLIEKLSTAKAKMAQKKRVEAQRLLSQAEQLERQ